MWFRREDPAACGAAAAVFTRAEHAAGVLTLTRDLPALKTVVAFGTAPEGAAEFAELLTHDGPVPEFAPDQAAAYMIGYTSGATGHPKGAVQSHRAILPIAR